MENGLPCASQSLTQIQHLEYSHLYFYNSTQNAKIQWPGRVKMENYTSCTKRPGSLCAGRPGGGQTAGPGRGKDMVFEAFTCLFRGFVQK